jgi:hypothetical protein
MPVTNVSVQIQGLDKITSAFGKAGPALSKELSGYIKFKGDQIIDQYKNTVPVRTGRLRNSIRGGLEGENKYIGGANVPYAGKVEERRHNLKDAYNKFAPQIPQEVPGIIKKALPIVS